MADKSAVPEGLRTEVASGLPDSMILNITESYFTRDPNYNKGQTLVLCWKGEVEEAMSGGEPVETDLDEHPILFPCGDGWDTFDDGQTAEHDRGRKMFTDRSAIGMLIDQAAVTLDVAEALLSNAPADGVEAGRQAAIWQGFKFLLERQEFDYGINKQTNQPMKASRLMPTKVLASPGDSKGKKAAAKPAAKKEESTESESTGGGLLAGLDAKMAAKLKVAFSKAAGDEGKFADNAIEVDGVAENADLIAAVSDGSLFAELAEA